LFATIAGIGGKFKQFAEDEKRAHEFEEDFKTKLAISANETMKFEFQELKSLEPADQDGPAVYQIPGTAPTESNPPQFTSILGDMNIHEKYKE